MSGEVKILSPNVGSEYSSGDVIPIIVKGTGDITNLAYLAGNYSSKVEIATKDTMATDATFYYTVPENAIGNIKIAAIGYNSNGVIDTDTLGINISAGKAFDSIVSYPSKLVLSVGEKKNIALYGKYNNGTMMSLNSNIQVEYIPENTSIANHIGAGLIEGKMIGTTSLKIKYNNLEKNVPIEVVKKESWLGIEEIGSNPKMKIDSKITEIVVSPNPFNSFTKIQYILKENETIKLEIFNGLGDLIKTEFQEKQMKGKNSVDIDLRKEPSGLYFYKFTIQGSYETGKLINRK
jgi:hypothetical protein